MEPKMKTQYTEEAKKWADAFIMKLTHDEEFIDESPETSAIMGTFAAQEPIMQLLYDQGLDLGLLLEEPFLLQVFIARLNHLQVPRTRAAEIAAVLGVNTPEEAVMMAVLLKRIYETQDPKPERLTTMHIECLLSAGTVSRTLNEEMWEAQKGYNLGLPVDNLLDVVTAEDFEN